MVVVAIAARYKGYRYPIANAGMIPKNGPAETPACVFPANAGMIRNG